MPRTSYVPTDSSFRTFNFYLYSSIYFSRLLQRPVRLICLALNCLKATSSMSMHLVHSAEMVNELSSKSPYRIEPVKDMLRLFYATERAYKISLIYSVLSTKLFSLASSSKIKLTLPVSSVIISSRRSTLLISSSSIRLIGASPVPSFPLTW